MCSVMQVIIRKVVHLQMLASLHTQLISLGYWTNKQANEATEGSTSACIRYLFQR